LVNFVVELSRLEVTTEPVLIRIISNPYVIPTARGYQPVVDILALKTKKKFFIYIGSSSITKQLEALRASNAESLINLEFWIKKASDEKMAPYLLEE